MRLETSSVLRTGALLGVLALTGCATAQAGRPDTTRDPLEPVNRGVFWFNEGVYRYILEPIGQGWDFVLPDQVQLSIKGIYENINTPLVMLNNLLQAKPVDAGSDLARFVVNTTVGVLGVWDPARRIGLEAHDEDLGQTLGYWGVPAGPYLVLPILGPSNPRDLVGFAGESMARGAYSWFVPLWVSLTVSGAYNGLLFVNTASLNYERIRTEREAALDFYAFVRNAYVQNRWERVHDREEEPEPAEEAAEPDADLYYFEDEEEVLDDPDGTADEQSGEGENDDAQEPED